MERSRTEVSLLSELPVLLPHCIAALRQMKIVGVKVGKALEPLDIWDRDGVALQRNHPLQAELSHDAVEMDPCHRKRVGKLSLRQRQHEAVVSGQPNCLKAHQQLAQEMRQPLIGRLTAHVDQPLPYGALIHEG